VSIDPGVLYIVATPIGNLQDLSPRAIEVLRSVDLILAEDTRTSRHLLQAFGIPTPLRAYHDHNEQRIYPAAIARLQAGENIALISDAGTPLISDPGYRLIRAAHEAGLRLISVPGPCAVTAAVAVSGLACDRFTYEGFLPAKTTARRRRLEQLSQEQRTMVFFESPHRLIDSLMDMQAVFGAERRATVARELTKVHETIYSDTLQYILQWLQRDENQRKGEFVIVVEGQNKPAKAPDREAQRLLSVLLKSLPPSQAVAAASELGGGARNKLYRLALELSGKRKLEEAGDTS
jgi:16S rRNA (cytidine1402-2'-O)-methyltransferase